MYTCWNARAVGLAMSAEQAVEIAAEAGFDGVDLLVRDVVESGVDVGALKLRMDDLGLRGGGWTLPMNWKAGQEEFEADLERLPLYAETAARLGLHRTGTWVRFETEPLAADRLASVQLRRTEVERAIEWQMERLGRIAGVLADHGSRLGLEIIGSRSERTGRGVALTSTYRDLLGRFAGLRAEHANVGVLADAYHLYASGEPATAALAWGVDAVTWVHLADPGNPDRETMRDVERLLPGESDAGLCRSLLSAVAEGGYDGPVTAEPLDRSKSFPSTDPRERARMTRAALRQVWP